MSVTRRDFLKVSLLAVWGITTPRWLRSAEAVSVALEPIGLSFPGGSYFAQDGWIFDLTPDVGIAELSPEQYYNYFSLMVKD